MTAALLLVDLQQDYFPGGRHPVVGAVEAVTGAARLLSCARAVDIPIVHVQHISSRPDASFFLPGTDGVRFHPAVAPRPGETVVEKHYPNSFRETSLERLLRKRKVDRVVVAGMMTHMCIDATVRAAADLGFSVTLAADACATRDLSWNGATVAARDVQHAFLAALDGRYAVVLETDAAKAALRPDLSRPLDGDAGCRT
jgi:nicotinamidase-related amidase